VPIEAKIKATEVQFNGPIVLDTGRKIPVNKVIFGVYLESDWCLGWGKVFHDFLTAE
jgi:acetoacetate decarboxylase